MPGSGTAVPPEVVVEPPDPPDVVVEPPEPPEVVVVLPPVVLDVLVHDWWPHQHVWLCVLHQVAEAGAAMPRAVRLAAAMRVLRSIWYPLCFV